MAPIYVGDTAITKVYAGDTELDRVYQGDTLIYQREVVVAKVASVTFMVTPATGIFPYTGTGYSRFGMSVSDNTAPVGSISPDIPEIAAVFDGVRWGFMGVSFVDTIADSLADAPASITLTIDGQTGSPWTINRQAARPGRVSGAYVYEFGGQPQNVSILGFVAGDGVEVTVTAPTAIFTPVQ